MIRDVIVGVTSIVVHITNLIEKVAARAWDICFGDPLPHTGTGSLSVSKPT